jgi:hypothetical protein
MIRDNVARPICLRDDHRNLWSVMDVCECIRDAHAGYLSVVPRVAAPGNAKFGISTRGIHASARTILNIAIVR